MSDDGETEELSGLQWLSRERPEAMEHLLAFFRESGRHLDPKTRFLISVVTKVVRLSPRGLRQYIPRALREGASRDEVLDAILCAYPAAGLTNVIEAVQILRALEGEAGDTAGESEAEGAPQVDEPIAPPSWVTVAAVSDIAENSAKVVAVKGKTLAIFNVGGEFRAIANRCLHEGGYLGHGMLHGDVVTCSRHGWQFDVTNGECVSHPGQAVESYEVQVVSDEVRVFA